MRRSVPLSRLSADYEARARRRLALALHTDWKQRETACLALSS